MDTLLRFVMIAKTGLLNFRSKAWEALRPLVLRVYIFFATPKTMVACSEPPYFRHEKSEFREILERILQKFGIELE